MTWRLARSAAAIAFAATLGLAAGCYSTADPTAGTNAGLSNPNRDEGGGGGAIDAPSNAAGAGERSRQ